MTREEAESFVVEALGLAMARDASSGGIIRTVTLDASGATERCALGAWPWVGGWVNGCMWELGERAGADTVWKRCMWRSVEVRMCTAGCCPAAVAASRYIDGNSVPVFHEELQPPAATSMVVG